MVEHKAYHAPLRDFTREISWGDEGTIIDDIGDKVYIKHLDGPLFFGFASRFQDMIKALPDMEVVIIRMERVPYIDKSGLYALEEALFDLQEQKISVVFSGLHDQPEDMVRRVSLIPGMIPEDHNFKTFHDCTEWLYAYLGQEDSFGPLYDSQRSPDGVIGI